MFSNLFFGDQKQSRKNIKWFLRYSWKVCFFRLFQKIKLGDFWVENFPIFPIQKLSKDVFKSLLWGPGKKYWALFEIFPKTLFFRLFKMVRPSVRPSVRQYKLALTPGTPLLENRRLEHSTCKTRHSTCKTSWKIVSP